MKSSTIDICLSIAQRTSMKIGAVNFANVSTAIDEMYPEHFPITATKERLAAMVVYVYNAHQQGHLNFITE